MKANQCHIDGINRVLSETPWIAKRSRVNHRSILIGCPGVGRCALLTALGFGAPDAEGPFLTIHEEGARSLSCSGFRGAWSVEHYRYESFRFQYWDRMMRFLLACAQEDFDLRVDYLWELTEGTYE